MKKILLLLFTFCFCSLAKAQNTFEKVIDTLGSVGALTIQETFDGGYIYCGTSSYNGNDPMVVKLDSVGTIEWAKVYPMPGSEGSMCIEQLPDSGFLMSVDDISANSKVWVFRLNAVGDTLWTKSFTAGIGSTQFGNNNTMALLNPGVYCLAGYYTAQPTNYVSPFLIVALNNNFVYANKTYFTSIYGSDARAVDKTFDNGFIMAGTFGPGPFSGSSDFYLIRTNGYGDTLWTRNYNYSTAESAFDVKQTTDSGFVFTGICYDTTSLKYNIFLAKVDSLGDTLWTKKYFSSLEQGARSIIQTKDGGYGICGYATNSFNASYDLYLIKTDINGDTLFTKTFGGINNDGGYFVKQTRDGGYILCGTNQSFGPGAAYIIKTDSTGNVLTGLKNAEINNPFGFEIFPNPNNGNFTMYVKNIPGLKGVIKIYNTNNQLVYTCQAVNNAQNNINLTNLPNGIYMLMLETGKNIFSQKISIQK